MGAGLLESKLLRLGEHTHRRVVGHGFGCENLSTYIVEADGG